MSSERRAALITGAGRNIGRAIALRLAQSGCDVAINVRENAERGEQVAKEARASGAKAVVCPGDVGSREDLRAIEKKVADEFGRLDILVNTAAIRPFRHYLEIKPDEWRRVMEVNVDGVFFLTQAFLPGMVERRWGRIINFTGMNSIRGYADRVHIAAAKHAVWGLTKALAREFGPHNITANCVSPGPTETDQEPAFAELIQAQVTEIPLGRLGKPIEIAALVGFLASEDAGFVTGQMVGANGGAET